MSCHWRVVQRYSLINSNFRMRISFYSSEGSYILACFDDAERGGFPDSFYKTRGFVVSHQEILVHTSRFYCLEYMFFSLTLGRFIDAGQCSYYFLLP